MAISFPLSIAAFADTLPISSVRWWLNAQQEFSGLGSGEFLGAELGPSYYMGEITIAKIDSREAIAIEADIASLDGSMNTFYLYDPRAQYPRLDPKGELLGASTPSIQALFANNKSMTIAGLPVGYQLSKGDYLAFNYGSNPVRRAFHQIVEPATAGAGGVTPAFEIRPHFRPGAAIGLAVTLVKPAAKVAIVPKSFQAGTAKGSMTEGMTFQVQQVP